MLNSPEWIALMTTANGKRQQAERCRAVLRQIDITEPAAALLAAYAAELEDRAVVLERLAGGNRVHGRGTTPRAAA